MKNERIVTQLGLSIEDKRVFVDNDDYIDICLNSSLSVGVDKDCTSIVLATYYQTLVEFSLFPSLHLLCIIVPVYRRDENYSLNLELSEDGLNEFIQIHGELGKELVLHKDLKECQTEDILGIITNGMNSSNAVSKEMYIQNASRVMRLLLKSILEDYLMKNKGKTFTLNRKPL